MNRGLHRFAVFTAAATFCLIVAGALVTSRDAGLSVPDWPLSYGSITPPWVGNIRYEHSHRVIAATVGLLTVCLAVWLRRRERRPWVKRLGYLAVGAVVAQGLLGGITVLFFLPAAISVSHACLAQIFFCLAVTLALVTGERWQQPALPLEDEDSPPLGQMTVLTSGAIFLQLVMGAALRHKGFGIVPHLVGATIVTALVLWTIYRVFFRHSNLATVTRPAAVMVLLLMVQLLLGGASYLVREATREAPQPMPVMVYITVAHVAIGAATLAASVWLLLEANRALRPAPGRTTEQAAVTT